MQLKSELHLYSLGIVARNKSLQSVEIEVTPIERVQMVDGELTDDVKPVRARGIDADRIPYETEVNTAVTIKATWYPGGGNANRLTPPDVRRGEKVELWRYGDTDKYYWKSYDNDLHYRKLETVTYGYSATREEDVEPSADNTYVVEVSTHRKHLLITTTMKDEEPFKYTIKLDTKEGVLTIADNIHNTFTLNSKSQQIRMENSAGSFIDMTGSTITMRAEVIDIRGGSGDVVIEDISHMEHKHAGVTPGGATTQEPVA